MKLFPPAAARASAITAACLALAMGPAHAALKTWYVAGTFDDANCGTPLERALAEAYPSGTDFKGRFTFDDAAAPIAISDGRYDFATQPEQGGGVQLVTKKTTLTSDSSRVITQLSSDRAGNVTEELRFNANTYTTGAELRRYGSAALDLVSMTATGVSWFTAGSLPAAPPALRSANAGQACLDIFYFDPKRQRYHHRFGNVTVFQDNPF
jgi:hypothetical protein